MPELEHAVKVAKKSGKYLLENFRKHTDLTSRRGTPKEVVTRFDEGSDEIIKEELSKEYSYNLLTEESGRVDRGSDCTWVVDSLDGTGNFALGNPFFSVSIALMENKELRLGVIYAPFLDELYTAEKGEGAFLNGERIKVSEVEKIQGAYFLSCEGGEKTSRRIAEINHILNPRSKDMRKLGSAAIEGSYVASKRAEGYLTTSIDPWDVAAAVLLVREAGGEVTDFKGNEWSPERQDVLMSNGLIHGKILRMIKGI